MKRILQKTLKNESGFVLPVILITGIMITLMIIAVSSATVTNQNVAVKSNYQINSQLAADAGLDDAMNKINTTPSWTGTGGEVILLSDATHNIKTTYQVTVTSGADSTKKTLTVTARTYSPITASTPKTIRKYDLDIQAVTSGDLGPTSVASGVGGLILSNNSKISGGDVVVNGKISMSNNSQIGLSTNPVNVRVAHQSCPSPADATYPQVCGSGNGQPISMNNNSKIYGDVRANNQTNGANMFSPGLTVGNTVTPTSLPTYDRTTHPVSVTKNATDSGIACPNNNGNVTWPANVKIVGNINMGNNCTINVSGNVWITGTFTTGNQGNIKVADSVGTTRPIFMVDGSSGFTLQNNGKVTPNASGTGIELRTFWSAAGCSPGCTSVTGTALSNSQNVVTIDLGNQGNATNSVFVAQWSKVRVSNNGTLGAVGGETVELGNQAVISFTASVPGSNNIITTWVKRGYMRIYN